MFYFSSFFSKKKTTKINKEFYCIFLASMLYSVRIKIWKFIYVSCFMHILFSFSSILNDIRQMQMTFFFVVVVVVVWKKQILLNHLLLCSVLFYFHLYFFISTFLIFFFLRLFYFLQQNVVNCLFGDICLCKRINWLKWMCVRLYRGHGFGFSAWNMS